jgi:hypothetical protein
MLIKLRCNNTLLNDHFLEVTWDSIEVASPPTPRWLWIQ